ncbi:MAG: T9SS type A sorting domain-containing protein [Bacteroidia bacterium]|nr:T9SS type A sorting domain-containing protein [Bacteroidia bacterium]
MKKSILLSILVFIVSAPQINSQKLIKNSMVTGICYAGNKVKKIYIPPPEKFLQKGGVLKEKATVKVYYSGTPANIVTAVDFAAAVLETILPSDAYMTVAVSTGSLTSDVLANSSTSGLAGGWAIDALDPNAFYPVALAEKIYGESLNDDLSGDIVLTINTDVNWYTGTDGNTPISQYDLVTVVLHELLHGLGLFDSMSGDASTGSWGFSNIPVIYDSFIENQAGNKLIDTLIFINPSVELKNELTGGHLYLNGPLLKDLTSGQRARIYAPSTYDPGSSISHLDEDTTPDSSALMTPFIDKGEAIHNPGKLIMSILGDLGWVNTRFIHEKPADTEEHLSQIAITAAIVSDTTFERNKVGLVWSFDGFSTYDTVYMSSPQLNDTFTVTIPIPYFDANLEYYMFVRDHFLRIYRSPSYVDEFRYSVRIGMDTVKPVMVHTPVEYYFEKVDTITFEAQVADNIGIDTVYAEYLVNEGASGYIGLKAGDNYSYTASLKAGSLSLQGGDSIRYRIIARDKASVPNTKTVPENGYFTIRIEDISSVVSGYSTDFTDASGDFFNIGFEIVKPNNFLNYGLHSEHPYVSPETNDGKLNFSAMLRHPVIFDANGMIISFMELVLVEPGEDGSVYGSEDFYDYVIIEGSKNYGKTWFPLTDGYDSRYIKSWETAYNSSITGNNSTYVGKESMMLKHIIFPKTSSSISGGDTMMVRFRLFSDPFANGWGWAIEDFHIGPLIDRIEKTSYETAVVYPNPGKGLFKIKDLEISGRQVRYEVYSSTGVRIKTDITNGSEELAIDISGQPSGLYFIVVRSATGSKIHKYTLIK